MVVERRMLVSVTRHFQQTAIAADVKLVAAVFRFSEVKTMYVVVRFGIFKHGYFHRGPGRLNLADEGSHLSSLIYKVRVLRGDSNRVVEDALASRLFFSVGTIKTLLI